MFPARCINTQNHQNCSAVKSHPLALAIFQNMKKYLENKERFEWNVLFVFWKDCIFIIQFAKFMIHWKLHLLSPKISCSLKQIFAQCKISLEGTLILSNLKMINKMSTLLPLEKFLRTPMNNRAFSLSFFSCFHSLRIVCFFSLSWFRLQNKHNQAAFYYYFIKITCNNKCYAQSPWVLYTIPNKK